MIAIHGMRRRDSRAAGPFLGNCLSYLGGKACIGPFKTLNGGTVHLEEVISRSDSQAIVNCYGHISRLSRLALSHILSPEKGIANYPRRRRFSSVPPET